MCYWGEPLSYVETVWWSMCDELQQKTGMQHTGSRTNKYDKLTDTPIQVLCDAASCTDIPY